ncbi:MAG: polymer-forming cytoskeletal protein [Acidobacteriota bacterium]|nr:polymer-forming cytoskeletal protein [Acidobacteriota bacterium]
MWKKSEDSPVTATSTVPPAAPPARPGAIATLGPSIVIKGDLTGEEDLVIEGRVEGEIRLTKNSVTVGKNGRVKADIYGKRVHVDGEVRGNLYGDQEIVIRASGRVQGNLVSPRVTLENGSKFKGAIDMEPAKPMPSPSAGAERKSAPGPSPASAAPSATPKSPSTGATSS